MYIAHAVCWVPTYYISSDTINDNEVLTGISFTQFPTPKSEDLGAQI